MRTYLPPIKQKVTLRRIMMITWVLLVSLVYKTTQDGIGQKNGVLQCGPQDLTLTTANQMILLTWEDDPSCSVVHDKLIYELEVFIEDMQVHHDEVVVMPEQIKSTHVWNWTSHLAMECASHSVRLRSRYNNQTSSWKQQWTLPGSQTSDKPAVYPRDKVVKVGSRVTFCCVLSDNQTFDKMYVRVNSKASMNITKISNRTYAMTVQLDKPSIDSYEDVLCKTSSGRLDGASVFAGYPPEDEDLKCETQDLESVDCHWKTNGRPYFYIRTTYRLLDRPCQNEPPGRCRVEVPVDVGEKNWTLTAQNQLGKLELSDRVDLMKRVHMFAPEGVTTSAVNTRNVTLQWTWRVQHYYNLNIKCQVIVISDGTRNTSEHFGVGLNFAVVTDLIPNCTYDVAVKCGTKDDFWKWSDWSRSYSVHTNDDVPDPPDVWMQRKDNRTIIIWKKPLANESHGDIIDYTVSLRMAPETEQQSNRTTEQQSNRTTEQQSKRTTEQQLALNLDTTEQYFVTVTMRNIKGSSHSSSIVIPRFNPDTTTVKTFPIIGSNGRFNLSWSASPQASCGYIVDWCATSGDVEWLKLPPHQTNAWIFSENFRDGVIYSLSVYACTKSAPVLLERREGYVKEKRILAEFLKLKWKAEDSNIVISWDRVSLKEQPAFIKGYVLHWKDQNGNVNNVSTDNPEDTSLTASNVKIGSYDFKVTALTALGECGDSHIDVTLDSQTDPVKPLIIALFTVFGLLSVIVVVLYKQWTCIKEKVYPQIPVPLLKDNWSTLQGKHSCYNVDQCHHSEEDIMDVPEMHNKSTVPENSYTSHENISSVYTQTPKGYYNQSLKILTPPSLILPTTAPSQSGLPSSAFKCVFPNPSYNLIMQPKDQQPNIWLKPQEQSLLERCSNEYQPQCLTETLTLNVAEQVSDSSITCNTTYILVPQSPPTL